LFKIITEWWIQLPLLFLILISYLYKKRLPVRLQNIYAYISMISLCFSITILVYIVIHNINTPPEWDFLAFWLDGRVFAAGLNFYQPGNYLQIASNLNYSNEFLLEIINVGFRYPPMTMFIIAPLGWLPLSSAYIVWLAINLAFFSLDLFLLWKFLFWSDGVFGLILVSALTLMLRNTISTFYTAQTNFLILAFLLLYILQKQKFTSGIWLALAGIVKPFMFLLTVQIFVERSWKKLAYFAGTIIISAILSLFVFGKATILSYIFGGNINKLPDYVYTEMVNQSLLATLIRNGGGIFPDKSPVLYIPYLLISGIFLLLNIGIVFFIRSDNSPWATVLLLESTLILYPGTLEHYCVLLVLPMLMILSQHNFLPVSKLFILGSLISIFILVSFRDGSYAFYGIAFTWFVNALIIFILQRQNFSLQIV
jgi:hypothetical protein